MTQVLIAVGDLHYCPLLTDQARTGQSPAIVLKALLKQLRSHEQLGDENAVAKAIAEIRAVTSRGCALKRATLLKESLPLRDQVCELVEAAALQLNSKKSVCVGCVSCY